MKAKITKRQTEMLRWIAQGKTAGETGTILGISARTVEWHLREMRLEFSAVNVVHLVAIAFRAGIISAIGLGLSGFACLLASRILGVMDWIGAPGGIA